ncbi:MAG: ABC transporter substrate-binding protein [Phycisphaerales bacterium JB058]
MPITRILFAVVFVSLVAVPLVLRPADKQPDAGEVRQLIVITPHLAQLREEFDAGFRRWHEAKYGEPVRVQYLAPGGTSEIIKQLSAQYAAAWDAGKIDHTTFEAGPGTIPIDVMFGGGSYDHGRLMTALSVKRNTEDGSTESVTLPMSIPAGFESEWLQEIFGPNAVGSQPLYEKDQHWIATALSSFGIVYNRNEYADLGLSPPQSFHDLTDPNLFGRLALADPRQSGSITTTLDYILAKEGWEEGWKLLRGLSANARYFSGSSGKPPIDVSSGEAAAGLAIDFYGKAQAQSALAPGLKPSEGRVGYADPAGSVYIDPDPVSILRGGPEPELAKRFVEYLLTEQGQSIWNFRPNAELSEDERAYDEEGVLLGPSVYALRRMPARRVMYEKHMPRLMDKVNPFLLAGTDKPSPWRSSIGPMMGAFGIDTADEIKAAWQALIQARADDSFPPVVLAEMERLFYALPEHLMPPDEAGQAGEVLPFTPENYRAIRNSWRDPKHPEWAVKSQIRYVDFFRKNYGEVVRLGRTRALSTAGNL